MQRFDCADIENMPQRYRAAFVNSLSGFKSANVVGTQNKLGHANLAMISSVFHLGADPALMGMIIRPHTVRRDTLENIIETGFYTINHVNQDIVRQAHHTSARYDAQVSEFEQSGLDVQYEASFFAPFVKQSMIKIGLSLKQIQPISLNQTQLVIGGIEQVLIDQPSVIQDDGYVDIEAAGSVAVSGLDHYHQSQSLGRFEYAKPNTPVRKLGQ